MEYISKKVVCPFYQNSNRKTLQCEGVFSSVCISKFEDECKRKEYMLKYCCDKYKDCDFSKMLGKKYF